MTCPTCGRENVAHLTFCQECGQRLGPRIAPPTPPIGLSGDPFAPSGGPVPTAAAPHAHAHEARPRPTSTEPASPARAPSPPASERRCKICDTPNAPNLRYCTACGSTLDAPTTAAALAAPPAEPAPSPPPSAALPVHVLGPRAPSVEVRTCSRCHGAADAGAQFCKFCGHTLAEPSARPVASPAAPLERLQTNGSAPGERAPAPARAPQASARDALTPRPAGAVADPFGPSARKASSYGPPPQSTSGAAALAAIPPRPSATPAPSLEAAPITRGRLVVIAKSGADGPMYPFGDLLDVGRSEGDVVITEDPYLSPRHVRIVHHDGKLLIRDLASTNGVYLRLAAHRDVGGGSPSRPAEVAVPLTHGDMILVGQQVLSFEVLNELEGDLGQAREHGTLLFGSPAAPSYARLSQRTVEGIARDVYYLRKVETVLGRESGDVVFTEDPFLSRRHAAVRLALCDGSKPSAPKPSASGGPALGFLLVDLGSSNGTFVRIRGDVELTPGDHFRVGQQLFRVDFDGARR